MRSLDLDLDLGLDLGLDLDLDLVTIIKNPSAACKILGEAADEPFQCEG